jgi:tRNA/tmRNA/rRNA uracil-C5-methylase (TrmA/RlmC/RlmD family)
MSAAPIIEVTPTAFAYGGEVIGRLPDGRAVFIPFALPGERVSARLVEEKRSYARAELVEILQASPQRIARAATLANRRPLPAYPMIGYRSSRCAAGSWAIGGRQVMVEPP